MLAFASGSSRDSPRRFEREISTGYFERGQMPIARFERDSLVFLVEFPRGNSAVTQNSAIRATLSSARARHLQAANRLLHLELEPAKSPRPPPVETRPGIQFGTSPMRASERERVQNDKELKRRAVSKLARPDRLFASRV